MTELPAEAKKVIPFQPKESIINCWAGGGSYQGQDDYLTLTNFRVILVEDVGEQKGTFNAHYVRKGFRLAWARDLANSPPPRFQKDNTETDTENGIFPQDNVLIAGKTFTPDDGVDAQAIVDEITFARSRLIPPDAEVTSQSSGEPPRQVIIKEVIKVRCRYCGSLNLESDSKCSTCGAPLSSH